MPGASVWFGLGVFPWLSNGVACVSWPLEGVVCVPVFFGAFLVFVF